MQEPNVVGQHRLCAQDVEFGVQFADDLGVGVDLFGEAGVVGAEPLVGGFEVGDSSVQVLERRWDVVGGPSLVFECLATTPAQ